MKIILATIIIFFTIASTNAQVLEPSIVTKFNPSIVIKLLGIAKQTKLTIEQQYFLATTYAKADSTATQWLKEGKSISQIDSLLKYAELAFFTSSKINNKQKEEYSFKNGEKFANIAAKGEMQFLVEEYKLGNDESKLIEQWVKAKYGNIYNQYTLNNNDISNAKQGSSLYNLYGFYPTLYSNKFIEDFLAKLNTIKKVPDSIVKIIKLNFLNSTRENKYSDWSKNLLNITRYYLPDTIYYAHLYRKEFYQEAISSSIADKNRLVFEQHISMNAYDSVSNLIINKNYINSLLQYTYGTYQANKADSLIKTNSNYHDSLIKASLIRDGSLLSTNLFTIALKYKSFLKIDTSVINKLVYHAMYLSTKQDSIQVYQPFNIVDFRPYEVRILATLLNDEQFNNLLSIKNQPLALASAEKDWGEIEFRKLNNGINKNIALVEMTNFYLAIANARDRMADDQKKLTANMKIIEETKPYIVKILESDRWNETPKKLNNDLKLQW